MVLPKQVQNPCSLNFSRDVCANKKSLAKALWHTEPLPNCCLETSHFWSPLSNIHSSCSLKVILPLKNIISGSVCINVLGAPWFPFPQEGTCPYFSPGASQHLHYVCLRQSWVPERTRTQSPTSATASLLSSNAVSFLQAFNSTKDLTHYFLLTSSLFQSLLQKTFLIPQIYPSAELPTQKIQRPALREVRKGGLSIYTEVRSNNRLVLLIDKHTGFSGSFLLCSSSCWPGVPDILVEPPESQWGHKNVKTYQEFRQRSHILLC